jgi:hypothetical protein
MNGNKSSGYQHKHRKINYYPEAKAFHNRVLQFISLFCQVRQCPEKARKNPDYEHELKQTKRSF